MLDARQIVGRGFALGFEPDPVEPISAWADREISLPSEVTATPGQWSTDRVPFIREILDALGPTDPCDRVVFMKSTQVAATSAGVITIGHIAAKTPGPMMIVLPTLLLGKGFAAEKLQPVIKASPALKGKFVEAKSRDGGSTAAFKRFPGGFALITGANSAAGLRMHSIRFLIKDEIDAYPRDVEGEGDPCDLADNRTETFHNRKIFEASSPATEPSRIEQKYEAGTRAEYQIPCPHCKAFQVIEWERLDWSTRGTREDPAYPCIACDGLIFNRHKRAALAAGRWVHRVEWRPGMAKSYYINALYSPFSTWAQTVKLFVDAKGDKTKLKAFSNTRLARVWREKGEAPDHIRLWERSKSSSYTAGVAPRPVLFVTAGVDVQKDRLECEIVGWGEGERSWSIDYRVLLGSTVERDVWLELDKLLRQPIPAEHGDPLEIKMTCVDSGYLADIVYQFTRAARNREATKGVGYHTAPIIGMHPTVIDLTHSGKKIKRGAKVWPVGTHQAKLKFYDRLAAVADDAGDTPPGFCAFPSDYDQYFFKMLTAEALLTKKTRAGSSQYWEVFGRNEALDCRILNMAAANILGMHRLTDQDWRDMAASRGVLSRQEKRAHDESRQGDLLSATVAKPTPAQPTRPSPALRARRENFIPRPSWAA